MCPIDGFDDSLPQVNGRTKPVDLPTPEPMNHPLDHRQDYESGTYPDAPPNPERMDEEQFHRPQPLVRGSG